MTSFPERHRARRAIVILFAAMLATMASPFARSENYALIIGINNYPNATSDVKTLTYAEKDAKDVYAALLGRGFKSENMALLPDDRARRTDILRALRSFARDPDIGPEDQFIVFFSGHGLLDTVTGKPFWMTHDTSVALIEDTGIRLDHLIDYVQDVKAGKKLVLLDHCHSGQIVNRRRSATAGGLTAPAAGVTTTGRDSEVASILEKGPIPLTTIDDALSRRAVGMAVLAAAYDTAIETSKYTNGVFTTALLEALNTLDADISPKDKKLSIDELKLHLVAKVPELARAVDREQQVADEWPPTGSASWFVVESLPVGNLQAAVDERSRALHLLNTWEFKGWITGATKDDCQKAFDALVESLGERKTSMTESSTMYLRTCTNYTSGANAADREKARKLNDVLEAARKPSP